MNSLDQLEAYQEQLNSLQETIDEKQLDDDSLVQFLTFHLGKEEFGINILKVQEIKNWEEATLIPNSPEFIKGVINLRGAVVPVIDLRLRLKRGSVEFNATTVVIVVKTQFKGKERVTGVVVDRVSDVYDLSVNDVQDAPAVGTSIDERYIDGLIPIEEKMVITLNIDKLVHDAVMASN
jgi:purine-binding chemotaxis protein CheW